MLFSSGMFLKAFLPLVVIISSLLQRLGRESLTWTLILSSLFFYGYGSYVLYGKFDAGFFLIFTGSIIINFFVGRIIYSKPSKSLLAIGIGCNLILLAYFKYLTWISSILLHWGLSEFPRIEIVLPLAISFYTFEQISYLMDCYRKVIRPANFRDYLFFVMFFPKLIAGPIVRFSELVQQIPLLRLTAENFSVGITLFILGLAKKTLLADGAGVYVSPVFDAATSGVIINAAESWVAALAYTVQIYFDFSGYSDMALGLALLFGIYLPINFYSPYQATSIVDFWRRWHMTLSSFLRDYLYFPLGGGRNGSTRKYFNLILVMVIGGLWHGAGVTFIVWGAIHGVALAINHAFHQFNKVSKCIIIPKIIAWAATFSVVVFAWVFFRADSLEAAWCVLKGMAGQGDGSVISAQIFHGAMTVLGLLAGALFLPNSNQLIGLTRLKPNSATSMLIPDHARPIRYAWQPTIPWAIIIGILALCRLLATTASSPFLYFKF